MPSPFPGMDPFIESQRWTSFHDRFIVSLGDALVPQVRPRYVVDVGERVYLEREIFLTLRDRASNEVVTVIEVLSPSNKRPGSDGRKEYLEKRNQVLMSTAHLIELDLLRGGERLPASLGKHRGGPVGRRVQPRAWHLGADAVGQTGEGRP